MKVKHIATTLAVMTAVVAATASAATPATHSIVIRHQVRGCHSWSVDGGVWKAQQSVALRVGGWITITNNDVMPHQLVETSGLALRIKRLVAPMAGMGLKGTFGPLMMAHMGAGVKVTFTHAGVYRFTTRAGEDYMPGMKTIGEDNVLLLTVTVS